MNNFVNKSKLSMQLITIIVLVAVTISFTLPVFTGSDDSYAAEKYTTPKLLKNNKKYKIDINGGKKETVYVERKKVSKYYGDSKYWVYRYRLKINNKVVKTGWSTYENYQPVKFYYADIDKKDKYKEIFLVSTPPDRKEYNYFIYQYKSKKLVACKGTFTLPITVEYVEKSYKNSNFIKAWDFRVYGDGIIEASVTTDFNNDYTVYTKEWVKLKLGKSGFTNI